MSPPKLKLSLLFANLLRLELVKKSSLGTREATRIPGLLY